MASSLDAILMKRYVIRQGITRVPFVDHFHWIYLLGAKESTLPSFVPSYKA